MLLQLTQRSLQVTICNLSAQTTYIVNCPMTSSESLTCGYGVVRSNRDANGLPPIQNGSNSNAYVVSVAVKRINCMQLI